MASQQFSDADIFEALRAVAAELGEPLSKDTYAAHAGPGRPSWVRIVQRMDTWNNACALAGLETNKSRAYSRAWTPETCSEPLRAFLAESPLTSFAAYNAWAKGRAGVPSGQTVRNVFGSWQAAKDAVHR